MHHAILYRIIYEHEHEMRYNSDPSNPHKTTVQQGEHLLVARCTYLMDLYCQRASFEAKSDSRGSCPPELVARPMPSEA